METIVTTGATDIKGKADTHNFVLVKFKTQIRNDTI